MDAYDIFKKLTKGLSFKHRVLGIQNKKQSLETLPVKKEEALDIKQEVLSETEEQFISDGEQSEAHLSDSDRPENDENEELELLDGVKAGEKTKKKKKKKSNPEELKKKLEIEEQNRFRNEHGIRAVGRHVPAALRDFDELSQRYGVSEALLQNIRRCGYTQPTPVQRQVIPCMLEERQVLACAPTGSGKTLSFVVPLLHALGPALGGPRALVLAPTRELARQTYRELLRLGAASPLRCGLLGSLRAGRLHERAATFRKSDIVVTTPNRLCYLLDQENCGVTLDKVKWLIVDEADKLFEGSADEAASFRQQLERALVACGARGRRGRRVGMFSATHTPHVARWARRHMRGLVDVTVGHRNAAASSVQQQLLFCGNESGKLVAFRQLVQQGLKPPVLVFVQSKDRARQLFKELIYDGINVDVIHADRTQAQRDNVVRSFRVGRIWVLICTELMGRGIDFRGVNLVINFDFPPSAISYIHRIGRAGRGGQTGRAVTFFTQDDIVNLRSIASVMKQSGCEVPEYMLRLKQDPNKRKRLAQKAPHRDRISTVLDKRPDKRKIEEKLKEDNAKDAKNVQNGKNKKQRKIQDGVDKIDARKQDGDKIMKMKKTKIVKNGVGIVHSKLNKKQNIVNDKKNKLIKKKLKKKKSE